MKIKPDRAAGSILALFLYLFCTAALHSQQAAPEVPDKFNLDIKTAARLRPLLFARSTAISSRYAIGRTVFENLATVVPAVKNRSFLWELRIVNSEPFNAFSSPDGTIYVDSSLAQLADSDAGLWAAILSHEIAHALRRDWARRYLYEKSLQGSGTLVLGDSSFASGAWLDTKSASGDLARFCRQLELDADSEGLMLMARAGYHPDFVLALQHLLSAKSHGAAAASLSAMHPRWEEREHQLEHAYVAAGREFDRLWPDRFASPGGNPPVVVFADHPTVKSIGTDQWEVRLPMRCQNLVGVVEVVLRKRPGWEPSNMDTVDSDDEARQLTGCTSYKTLITFTLTGHPRQSPSPLLTDVYVLNDRGAMLSRAEVPGLRP
jgi:Zn-dependent protease with chaperone function